MPAKQPLEEARDILLVTRQPVERFRYDNIEFALPRVFQEGLIGRAQRARAALRPVGIGAKIFPALLSDPFAA